MESWECRRIDCTYGFSSDWLRSLTMCLAVLKHGFFGFVHAELSSNLIDSFLQDFEQVVSSRCWYYLFRAAFVLIALRWLRELRNWLSYWVVTLAFAVFKGILHIIAEQKVCTYCWKGKGFFGLLAYSCLQKAPIGITNITKQEHMNNCLTLSCQFFKHFNYVRILL